jgi:hypothetical protein
MLSQFREIEMAVPASVLDGRHPVRAQMTLDSKFSKSEFEARLARMVMTRSTKLQEVVLQLNTNSVGRRAASRWLAIIDDPSACSSHEYVPVVDRHLLEMR